MRGRLALTPDVIDAKRNTPAYAGKTLVAVPAE